MEIYIEYAFLENFLLDGALLSLSAYATKIKCPRGKICLSAIFGAVFALIFPLLKLSFLGGAVLKWSVGFLLCMPIAGKLRTKKDWSRYCMVSVIFMGLSFGFGGALLGVYNGFSLSGLGGSFSLTRAPSIIVFLGFFFLSLAVVWLTKKIYARRAIVNKLFSCSVIHGEKSIRAEGFLDSGNLAMKNGIPVCFLSPDLIYDLWGRDLLFGKNKGGGQVCDEIRISTVAGERVIPLYLGELEVKIDGETVKKRVYFSSLPNSISREYKILLNARTFEGSDT